MPNGSCYLKQTIRERTLIRIDRGKGQAFTRNGYDWSNNRSRPVLDPDASYLEAARVISQLYRSKVVLQLLALCSLTRQQIETYLDVDPDFLDVTKNMLREFIDKTPVVRLKKKAIAASCLAKASAGPRVQTEGQ